MKEILKNNNLEEQSDEIKSNLNELLDKMNKIRDAYGKPMIITSGLRSMADHLRIYEQKGITDTSKIPMKSRHLYGLACDVSDPKQELQKWCQDNEQFLRDLGVFMEDFSATKNWVHFQIVPYASFSPGKSLWFKP